MGGALGGSAPSPAPAATGCTGLSAAQVARFDAIQAALKVVPTDGFDPVARAQELTDIDATFAFVRDHIQTEAYAGAMRGAAGTLQARAGSPADKALLLAALLGQKDIPVRFVHAPLADADASAIVAARARTRTIAVTARPQRCVQDARHRSGASPRRRGERTSTLRSRRRRRHLVGAEHRPTRSSPCLKSKNQTLAADDTALHARWAANLHDHWWLQAQENGAWVDLDRELAGRRRRQTRRTGAHRRRRRRASRRRARHA